MLIKFRYNNWEIPQLIHLITIALELCPRVDEFRDDNVSCVYWKNEGSPRSEQILKSIIPNKEVNKEKLQKESLPRFWRGETFLCSLSFIPKADLYKERLSFWNSLYNSVN
jgi:hypothetical protein